MELPWLGWITTGNWVRDANIYILIAVICMLGWKIMGRRMRIDVLGVGVPVVLALRIGLKIWGKREEGGPWARRNSWELI